MFAVVRSGVAAWGSKFDQVTTWRRLKSRNHEKRGCFSGNSIEVEMLPVPVQRDFESRADDASAPLSAVVDLNVAPTR